MPHTAPASFFPGFCGPQDRADPELLGKLESTAVRKI